MGKYSGDPYILIPSWWLDDYKIAKMPDEDFVQMIRDMANDPNQIHYSSANPMRLEWLRVRTQMIEQVFARDKHECRYCGSTDRLEIDHIIPLARGGLNELDNLQILCKRCNCKKWAN